MYRRSICDTYLVVILYQESGTDESYILLFENLILFITKLSTHLIFDSIFFEKEEQHE